MFCEIIKLYICPLTFTEGAGSADVSNQEKHRRASQSLSVPALRAKNWEDKAGHRTTSRCTQRRRRKQPDEVYLTDLIMKSRVWLARTKDPLSSPSLLDSSFCLPERQHHCTSDVVSFPNQSHKKQPCLLCAAPPLSCSPSTPTAPQPRPLFPWGENPAYETSQPVTQAGQPLVVYNVVIGLL